MSGDDGAARERLRTFRIDDSGALARRLWERFLREIPQYADVDAADTVPSMTAAVDTLVRAIRESRGLDAAETEQFRDYGALRARLGVPLEAMLRGWQLMISELVERIGGSGDLADEPGTVLMSAVSALLEVSDAATIAFSAGHRDAEAQISRRLDSRRDDLVRALMTGTLGTDRLRRGAQYMGLRLTGRYSAFRAITAEPEQTEWDLRQLPACRPPHGLAAILDGDVVGICTPDLGSVARPGVYLGLGPTVELDELPRSFLLAGRVAETARLFAQPGEHTLVGMGLLPAVAGDSEVGAALFDRYIAPVRDSEALPVLGTVDCYLSTGMNASETAQRMHLHHNMVRYRLARFEELTGVGLKEPHAALQVWWALRYRDLLEAPGRPDA